MHCQGKLYRVMVLWEYMLKLRDSKSYGYPIPLNPSKVLEIQPKFPILYLLIDVDRRLQTNLYILMN